MTRVKQKMLILQLISFGISLKYLYILNRKNQKIFNSSLLPRGSFFTYFKVILTFCQSLVHSTYQRIYRRCVNVCINARAPIGIVAVFYADIADRLR